MKVPFSRTASKKDHSQKELLFTLHMNNVKNMIGTSYPVTGFSLPLNNIIQTYFHVLTFKYSRVLFKNCCVFTELDILKFHRSEVESIYMTGCV